jgi:acetyl esterase/lipase
LFGWSFFASWITIELAWVHLVWQIAVTAWFARRGALKTRIGRLGLVVSVASWAGLIVLIWRSLGTRHQIREAFASWEGDHPLPLDLGCKVTKHITYRQVGNKKLKLDVFEPAQPAAPGSRRPAILQIHGGGWVIGDKREQGLPLLKLLASQGWVGINANYRLSPRATFPDHIVDLKHAVAWIREHADDYDIDPHFIAVTGGSAGGHLTALMALTANAPEYQHGFEDVDTSLQAAVPFYGIYDFVDRNRYMAPGTVDRFLGPVVLKAKYKESPEKFAAASPLDQVRADAPPFLIIHGDKDTLAPVEGARDFATSLSEMSDAPVLYLELEGAQHAFELFPSIRANLVLRSVHRFLDKLYREHLAGRDAAEVDEAVLVDAVDAAVS